MSGTKKQLSLWIDADLKTALDEQAAEEHRTLTAVLEEVIREHQARRRGEILETESLPLIRRIVGQEIYRALQDFRKDLEDDQERTIMRRLNDVFKLGVQTRKDAIIGSRLVYWLFQRLVSKEEASKHYQWAADAAAREVQKPIQQTEPGK